MAVNALRGKANIARHSARFDDGSTPLNPIRTARRPCVYIKYIYIILVHMDVFFGTHGGAYGCVSLWQHMV